MTLDVRVLRKTRVAEGIAAFELGRPDGTPLPAFSAGSHVDVHTPGGIVRQYSLCRDDGDRTRYRIAVLREPASRGGSAAMHEQVREGDTLTISEPRNHFPLVHAVRTVLFAGGIGITPLLCMAQRLHAVGADFELHYCTRSRERTAFADEITASPFAGRVHHHFDDGPPSQRLRLEHALGAPDAQTHVYVCGPGGFMDHVVKGAQAAGWRPAQIHTEYFAAAPQDTGGDKAFQVKIASTGAVHDIPATETVVHALRRHGVEILTSCEQGVCGTCITRVLDGECDHRDLYFTDEEKARHDQFTPCCSRAKSPLLVLDL